MYKSGRWKKALSLTANESIQPLITLHSRKSWHAPYTSTGRLKILNHKTCLYVTPFRFHLRKINVNKETGFPNIPCLKRFLP